MPKRLYNLFIFFLLFKLSGTPFVIKYDTLNFRSYKQANTIIKDWKHYNSQYLFSVDSNKTGIDVYRYHNLAKQTNISLENKIYSLAVSTSGDLLAVGTEDKILTYNAKGLKQERNLAGFTEPVYELLCLSEGNEEKIYALYGSIISYWNVTTNQIDIRDLGFTNSRLFHIKESSLLLIKSEKFKKVILFDTKDFQIKTSLDYSYFADDLKSVFKYSKNQLKVIKSNGSILLVNFESDDSKLIRKLNGVQQAEYSQFLRSYLVLEDNKEMLKIFSEEDSLTHQINLKNKMDHFFINDKRQRIYFKNANQLSFVKYRNIFNSETESIPDSVFNKEDELDNLEAYAPLLADTVKYQSNNRELSAEDLENIENYNKKLLEEQERYHSYLRLETFTPRIITDTNFSDNFKSRFSRDSLFYPLETVSNKLEKKYKLDTSGKYLISEEILFGEKFSEYSVFNLDDYQREKLAYDTKKQFYEEVSGKVGSDDDGSSAGSGFDIYIPFKIKNKSFNRVFGGERIGLNVKGDISLTFEGALNSYDGETKPLEYKMDQTQNFTVKGKVGTKVTVDIAQNTESFDFENNVKIKYTGDSDEIIQNLEAGNTSLALPRTEFATASASNKGLFGIKTDLKFGNLTSTIIASLEKGEKKKKSFEQGKSEPRQPIINIADYSRKEFFFADPVFRSQYIANFENLKEGRAFESSVAVDKDLFKLYLCGSALGSGSIDKKDIILLNDVNHNSASQSLDAVEVDDNDYELDDERGIIRYKRNLSSGQYLAVVFKTINGQQFGNNLNELIEAYGIASYDESGIWENLEMKNIYKLGYSNISSTDFELTIKYNDDKDNLDGKTYLSWFDASVDNVGDEAYKVQLTLLDKRNGFFEFPVLTPFNPDKTDYPDATFFSGGSEESLRDSVIYVDDNKKSDKFTLNFKFTGSSSGESGIFNLDMNVLEGSEKVTVGSRELVRGIDYTIDYFSGQLSIYNEKLLTDKIDITYESAQLFSLDTKTLLGANLRYDFGRKNESYLSASALYFSQTTSDDKVKLGYEPVENTMLDLVGKTTHEVPYLTKAIDALPFLETDEESKISIEGEVAKLFPNNNPKNKAYIDDFEGSKRENSLGIDFNNWSIASVPDSLGISIDKYSYNQSLDLSQIAHVPKNYFLKNKLTNDNGIPRFYWFNPDERTLEEEIYKGLNDDEIAQKNKIKTLKFHYIPRTREGIFNEPVEKEDLWAGVMRYIPPIYQDLSDIKYISILVRSTEKLKLNIDIGSLSEDAIPNNQINSEDLYDNHGKIDAQFVDNGVLEKDVDQDVGLDMQKGNSDYFSLNRFSVDSPYVPVLEEYSFDNNTLGNDGVSLSDLKNKPWMYHLTENNDRLDTEDLNYDGSLNSKIEFFRYTLDLNDDEANIANGYEVDSKSYNKGFTRFLIPLDSGRVISETGDEPDISNLDYLKLWFTGATDSAEIEIVDFNLIGNEWIARDSDKGKIEASTINTESNSYIPPFKLSKDDEGIEETEGSLRIKYFFTEKDTALVEKTKNVTSGDDFLKYSTMRMFIHGGGEDSTYTEDLENIYFVYRFGKNKDEFYEYKRSLVYGWEGNSMDVELEEFFSLKSDRADTLSNGAILINNYFSKARQVVAGDTVETLAVQGNPSLRNIKYQAAGVLYKPDDLSAEPKEGEIWIDDLRLGNVKNNQSVAIRGRVDLNLADFGKVSAAYRKKDADFHQVNTTSSSTVYEEKYQFDGSLKLEKLFPDEYGLSLPVSFGYNKSNNFEKYSQNSDILVDKDNIPDSVKTIQTSKTVTFAYKKNNNSTNEIVNYTLNSFSFNGKIRYDEENSYTYISRNIETYNYSANYALRIPELITTYKPFSWAENIEFLKQLKNEKFVLIPTSYNFSIATAKKDEKYERRNALIGQSTGGQPTFTISRTLNISGYQPFSFWTNSYTLSLYSNMYKRREGNTVSDVYSDRNYDRLLYSDFGELYSYKSSFKSDFKFNITKWSNFTAGYSSNYDWEIKLDETIGDNNKISNQFDITTGFTLKTKTIFNSLKSSFKEGVVSNNNQFSLIDFFKENLSDVNINLSTGRSNNHSKVQGFDQAKWDYILGFNKDPGLTYGDESWQGKWTSSIKTSLSLSRNVRLTGISYSLSQNYNENLKLSGSNSKTIFLFPWRDYTQSSSSSSFFDVFALPVPDYSISISGVEKLFPDFDALSGITLNHGKNGSRNESWYIDQNDRSQVEIGSFPYLPDFKDKYTYTLGKFTTNFSPLIGIKFSFKNNVSTGFSFDTSFSAEEKYNTATTDSNTDINGGQIKSERRFSYNLGYRQKGGFQTPFNFWPFNGSRINNDINYNLTISYSNSEETDWLDDGFKNLPRTRTTWQMAPTITYTFNKNINGSFNYKFNLNSNDNTGGNEITDYSHTFGFTMKIRLTGR